MKSYEKRHADDLDWWIHRYTALCLTKSEEVVRKATKALNEAVKLAEKSRHMVTQLDQEVTEAETEIARLGGAALIEELRPLIEARMADLLKLYETSKSWRPAEPTDEKPSE